MKLNSKNGKVEFLMVAGKDLVKNTMDEGEALKLIGKGKVTNADNHGAFNLCVDGRYYFPALTEQTAPSTPTKPKGKTKTGKR